MLHKKKNIVTGLDASNTNSYMIKGFFEDSVMILLWHIPHPRLKYFLSRFEQKWLLIAWTFLSSMRACTDMSKYSPKPSLTAWLIDKLIDNSNARDCHYIQHSPTSWETSFLAFQWTEIHFTDWFCLNIVDIILTLISLYKGLNSIKVAAANYHFCQKHVIKVAF